MKACEYLHATLTIMMIIPMLYALGEVYDEGGAVSLYVKCFLIIIPVIATELAARRIKSLAGYLSAGIALTAFVFGVAQLFFEESSSCYRMLMPVESFLIVIVRLRERIRLMRQEKEHDIYEAPAVSVINRPSLNFMWYFALMYAIGILFNSSALCDIAFWNAIIYFFIAMAHSFLSSTKRYIGLNKWTRNVPRKRLYAVGAGVTAAFAGIALIAMLPSIFMIGQRRYTDVRTWSDDMVVDADPAEFDLEFDDSGIDADMSAFTLGDEEALEPSPFWEYLGWAVGIACAIGMAYAAFRIIRQFFKDFRNSFDENGDRVEELNDEPADKTEGIFKRRRGGADSEAMRIRRLYKKTIKKNRKEIPAPYESPTELEKNAGLLGDEDMEKLHLAYEKVRYGVDFK